MNNTRIRHIENANNTLSIHFCKALTANFATSTKRNTAMKQLLFILLMLCANATLLKAESFSEFKEITLHVYADDDREIKDKDSDTPEPTQTRGLIIQPVYAYLYNNVISIDFRDTFTTVTVNIINEATGETVYSETCSNPASLIIDWSNKVSADYIIKIETDDTYWEGCFSL